jgi:hypothetical protein
VDLLEMGGPDLREHEAMRQMRARQQALEE